MSTQEPVTTSASPRTSGGARSPSRLRYLLHLAKVACGLAVGLALAEAAFWYRDRGAFPHLNVYAPDARLAVSLEPGATERVALPGNPVTRVRINSAGLRGELPPRSDKEIVVVGDSQVFGLGVEEDETMSAELGRLLGAPVVNAGVPTYGPLEYNAVAERLLRERHPHTIVYVVNFSNDLFEARHPNSERLLLDDLVDSAEALGALGINTLPALIAAEPGAFLPNDLHMTPKGHGAVAAAIAQKLRAAP